MTEATTTKQKGPAGRVVPRTLAYWLDYVSSPYNAVCWLGWSALRRSLIVGCKLDQVGPITVSNCTLRRDLDDPFAQATRAALEMIRRHDPRRSRLIERELRLIVNQALTSGAAYDRRLRQCKVDFPRYWTDGSGRLCADPQADQYEWYLARYASMLVHEAVHGRLDSLRFAYTRKTRLRIERICVGEQRRFLAHLPRDRYDFMALVPPFDARRWEDHWRMGRWERFKRLTRRLGQREPAA